MIRINHKRRSLLTLLGTASISLIGWENEQAATPSEGLPPSSNVPDSEQSVEPIALAGRTVGIVATEPDGADFGSDVIQRIIAAGSTSTSLSVYWDDVEQSAGIYAPEINYMAIAEIFYPPFDIAITHSFSVIDTTNKRLPADLSGRAFDDPEVISRFNAMLDWAATQMPSVNLHVISIGNEVDVYLNAHPEEWPAWQTFFTATAAHARTLWPNAVIGCKATNAGLSEEPSRSELQMLNQESDAVFVTWYGIDESFNALLPNSIASAFTSLVGLAEGKPLRILELGYPSATELGGSEQKQADFIVETFKAWDQFAAEIPHIEFFALHDFAPELVDELEDYYGLQDDRFAAYLGTLGLRTWSNRDKLAWPTFINEMSRRSAN